MVLSKDSFFKFPSSFLKRKVKLPFRMKNVYKLKIINNIAMITIYY